MLKNPEIFELCAGLSMARLYERFPIPANIDFRSLYTEIYESFPDSTTAEYVQIYVVVRNTFEWLQTENYIRYAHIGENSVQGAQLSEKGLRALKAIPSGLDQNKKSLADFLSDAVKTGAKDALIKGFNFMITTAVTGAP